MNKRLLLPIFLTLFLPSLLPAPGLAQAEMEADPPVTVPQSSRTKASSTFSETDQKAVPGTDQSSSDVPTDTGGITTPQPTLPPNLLPRPPIPTPPAVTLLSPMHGGRVKDTLSWRTRAYKMRAENSDVKNGLVKGSRLINASFEDTIAALTAVCSTKGITIDSIFAAAGQVLAHPGDGSLEKSRIIFSVKPVTKTSTIVRVGLDADNHLKQNSFDDIFNQIESSINEKGLL